jgi:hypothetical protein
MTPALKTRIQDMAVGAVAGALAVGLTVWRDVGMLQKDVANLQKDMTTVAEFFRNAFPGYSLLIPPPPKLPPKPPSPPLEATPEAKP